jgi:hypothetical protein
MYSVTITGFNTKEQAESFASWYENQGEQDILVWLECSDIGVESFNADLRKAPWFNWSNNVLTFNITPH